MRVGCSSGYTPLTWVSKVWKVSSGHFPQGALGLNSVHPGFETSFFQLLSLREPVGERIGPGFQVQICTPPMDVGSTPGFFSCPRAGQPACQGAAGLCTACPSGVVSPSQGHLVSTPTPLCRVRKQIHMFRGLGHGQLWGRYSANHTIP